MQNKVFDKIMTQLQQQLTSPSLLLHQSIYCMCSKQAADNAAAQNQCHGI
jgi:hypothetical protein